MSTITTKDGTQIYYKDWGTGPVVTFSHGWPLNADMWDGQMLFLAQNGFRVVAHDRRGGRMQCQALHVARDAERQAWAAGARVVRHEVEQCRGDGFGAGRDSLVGGIAHASGLQ